ncbi:unnamed protein product [Amoebophrya sp. A25]|nr:unnamed protein product [Amoebophrya sp. A25]|eukprot:GSA25T00015193001.1
MKQIEQKCRKIEFTWLLHNYLRSSSRTFVLHEGVRVQAVQFCRKVKVLIFLLVFMALVSATFIGPTRPKRVQNLSSN